LLDDWAIENFQAFVNDYMEEYINTQVFIAVLHTALRNSLL